MLALAFMCGVSLTVDAKSSKRGVGVNAMYNSDYEALSPGVSWFYNWANLPPTTDVDPPYGSFQSMGIDFVPMCWNLNYSLDNIEAYLKSHPETKYLLGYNEPNFTDQANMTPAQAAQDWPRIQEFAKAHGLKLVSPAVNWSSWAQYNDPCTWLDEFFALLPDKGAGIDYVACHFYMPGVASIKENVGRLKKYGKPIWLTEFCAATGNISNDPNTQMKYMTEVVQYLEQDPDVFRYAWFMARTNNASWGNGINLLQKFPDQGHLTDLGKVFVYMSDFNPDVWHQTGQLIPASAYINQSGITLAPATDTGNIDVAPLQVGDFGNNTSVSFVEYNLDVPVAGTYNITLRYGSSNNQPISVYSDSDLLLDNATLTGTGGVGSWTEQDLTVDLKAGRQVLRFERAPKSGLNVRRMEIHYLTVTGASGIDDVTFSDAPGFVVSGNSIVADGDVRVYNMQGVEVGTANLPAGVYVVVASGRPTKIRL